MTPRVWTWLDSGKFMTEGDVRLGLWAPRPLAPQQCVPHVGYPKPPSSGPYLYTTSSLGNIFPHQLFYFERRLFNITVNGKPVSLAMNNKHTVKNQILLNYAIFPRLALHLEKG